MGADLVTRADPPRHHLDNGRSLALVTTERLAKRASTDMIVSLSDRPGGGGSLRRNVAATCSWAPERSPPYHRARTWTRLLVLRSAQQGGLQPAGHGQSISENDHIYQSEDRQGRCRDLPELIPAKNVRAACSWRLVCSRH
jgi:hypothetical protein